MTRAIAEYIHVTPRDGGYDLRCSICGATGRIEGTVVGYTYQLAVWRFEVEHQRCAARRRATERSTP